MTWTALLLMLLVHGITAQSPAGGTPAQWPSFRGPSASGVAEGSRLPERWDASTGANVLWTVTLPGLAHSSPIVWGDRVFVTSAVSSRGDATFKPGLYGEGTASEDRSVQRWMVMAHRPPDRQDRLAAHGVRRRAAREAPHQGDLRQRDARDRRPLRRRVLRLAGPLRLRHARQAGVEEGSRRPQHRRLRPARVRVGHGELADHLQGPGDRPVRHAERVLRARRRHPDRRHRLEDGAQGTAVVGDADRVSRARADARPSSITNASNYIRGYDPDTGAERWRLGGSSKITAPTPVFTRDVIIVASGRAPERPIFAIRPGAQGRHHAGGGAVVQRAGDVEQDRPRLVHADAAHLRGHALRARPTRVCSTPTTSRAARRSTGSDFRTRAAASAPRRLPPTGASICRARTATSSSSAPAARSRSSAASAWASR